MDEAPERSLVPRNYRAVECNGLVTALAAIAAAATTVATTAAAAAEAATAAAATEATTAAAETTGRTIFLRAGLIDRQLTAAEIDAIHLLRGDLSLFRGAHGDERETAGAAGHLVHGDINIGHGAELTKGRAELVLGGLERQVADV